MSRGGPGKRPSYNMQLPSTNQSKIKQVIDELYQKEKRYVKQYIRDDMLNPQNTIFNLERAYMIQTATGVEKPYVPPKPKEYTISADFKNGQIVFIGDDQKTKLELKQRRDKTSSPSRD